MSEKGSMHGPVKAYRPHPSHRIVEKVTTFMPQFEQALGVKLAMKDGHEITISQGTRPSRRAASAALQLVTAAVIEQEQTIIDETIARAIDNHSLTGDKHRGAVKATLNARAAAREALGNPVTRPLAEHTITAMNDLRRRLNGEAAPKTNGGWQTVLTEKLNEFPAVDGIPQAESAGYYHLICNTYGVLSHQEGKASAALAQHVRDGKRKQDRQRREELSAPLVMNKAYLEQARTSLRQAIKAAHIRRGSSSGLLRFGRNIRNHLQQLEAELADEKATQTVESWRYRLLDTLKSFPGLPGQTEQDIKAQHSLVLSTFGHLRNTRDALAHERLQRIRHYKHANTGTIHSTAQSAARFDPAERLVVEQRVGQRTSGGNFGKLEKRSIVALALDAAANATPSHTLVASLIQAAQNVKQKPSKSSGRLVRKLFDPAAGIIGEIANLTGVELRRQESKPNMAKPKLPIIIAGENKPKAELLLEATVTAIRGQEDLTLLRMINATPRAVVQTPPQQRPDVNKLRGFGTLISGTMYFHDRGRHSIGNKQLKALKLLQSSWNTAPISLCCDRAEKLLDQIQQTRGGRPLSDKAAEIETDLTLMIADMRRTHKARLAEESHPVRIADACPAKAAQFSATELDKIESTLQAYLPEKGYSPAQIAELYEPALDAMLQANSNSEEVAKLWAELNAPPVPKVKAKRNRSVREAAPSEAPIIPLHPHLLHIVENPRINETCGIKGEDNQMIGWGIADKAGVARQIVSTYYDPKKKVWKHDCAIICPTVETREGETPLVKPISRFVQHTAFDKQSPERRKKGHGCYMGYMFKAFAGQPCVSGFVTQDYSPAIICSFTFKPEDNFAITDTRIMLGQAQAFSILSPEEGRQHFDKDRMDPEFALSQELVRRNVPSSDQVAFRATHAGSILLAKGAICDYLREHDELEALFKVSGAEMRDRRDSDINDHIVTTSYLRGQNMEQSPERLLLPDDGSDAGLINGAILFHHMRTNGLVLFSRQMVKALATVGDARLQEGIARTIQTGPAKPKAAPLPPKEEPATPSPLDRFERRMAVKPDVLRVA